MTAIASARLTDAGPPTPTMGTLPSAANQLFYKGTMVSHDANGRAVVPTDADGLNAAGVSNATFDNRTGSEAGGLDDDLDIEIMFGVYGFTILGSNPIIGDLVYVVDNQTVSLDSLDGTRGVAGYVSEVREHAGVDQAFILFIPGGAGALAALAFASGHLSVPLGGLAFADGTVNGFDQTVFGFRLNNAIDDQPVVSAVALPSDIDVTQNVVVTVRAYIIDDAVDDDVTMVLMARFNGGDDEAPLVAQVLAETAADFVFTIPAVDVPAGAKALYLEADADAALDTSDVVIESIEVEFTRAT